MSLADLAAQGPANNIPWRTCAVCHALDTIPDTEAEALRTLLRSNLPYSEIRDLIADDPDTPLTIPRDVLSRHARGLCGAGEVLRAGR